ncbi:UNVERIFIED_CONTAM: hypothetical protein K2H54_013265 [Gekko kuhli]
MTFPWHKHNSSSFKMDKRYQKPAERQRGSKPVSGEKGIATGKPPLLNAAPGTKERETFARHVLSGASGTLCEEGGIQTSLFTTNFTPLKSQGRGRTEWWRRVRRTEAE